MSEIASVFGAGDIALERAQYANLSRFHRWRTGFNGFGSVPDVMASPPTVTVGAAAGNSTIGGSTSVGIGKDDTRMTKLGGAFEDSGVYKRGTKGGVRYRFVTDAYRFDMRVRSYLGQSQFSVFIDGKPVSKGRFSVEKPGLNDDTEHFVLYDFGAETLTYELANAAVLAAGSGYAVGDVITLAGGTSTTAAQVRVTAVNAGAVTAVAVYLAGRTARR